MLAKLKPDILLQDLRMPDKGGSAMPSLYAIHHRLIEHATPFTDSIKSPRATFMRQKCRP
jgi:hypothetical protein